MTYVIVGGMFMKTSFTRTTKTNEIRVTYEVSDRKLVRFNLMYDHGEYEALVSKKTKELLGRLFDLEKEMRDLDTLI